MDYQEVGDDMRVMSSSHHMAFSYHGNNSEFPFDWIWLSEKSTTNKNNLTNNMAKDFLFQIKKTHGN